MGYFTFRRRLSFSIVGVLLIIVSFTFATISGKVFAQAPSQAIHPHLDCTMINSLQPLSCLPASAQAKIRKAHIPHNSPQTDSALSVQLVAVTDVTGNSQTPFVPGERVVYTAYINNTSGNSITGTFTYAASGSSAECRPTFTYTNQTIPTGQSTWIVPTDLCGDEIAGSYGLKVTVSDQNNPNNNGSNQGGFTVNSDNLPLPSVWNNVTCYSHGYSSYQLGTANYRGEPACGPQPDFYPSGCDPNPKHFTCIGDVSTEKISSSNVYLLDWECVELSERFMYVAYGIPSYSANGNQIVSNYNSNTNHVLLAVTNNQPGVQGQLPETGDIFSYPGPSQFGHTTVVLSDAINGDTGTGPLWVIEQNDSGNGVNKISVTGWHITAVQSWLHHTLSVYPQTAAPGAAVLMTGVEQTANTTYYVNLGSVNLGQVTTDSNGDFVATFTVPQISGSSQPLSLVPVGSTTPYSQTVFYVS